MGLTTGLKIAFLGMKISLVSLEESEVSLCAKVYLVLLDAVDAVNVIKSWILFAIKLKDEEDVDQ